MADQGSHLKGCIFVKIINHYKYLSKQNGITTNLIHYNEHLVQKTIKEYIFISKMQSKK